MDQKKAVSELFSQFAKVYQEKYSDVGQYASTLQAFCEPLPKAGRILEVGCGPGNVLKFLLGHRPDLKAMGIDLAAEMIALAKADLPQVQFERMAAQDITQIQQSFDGILAAFCIPYLSKEDTLQLIADAGHILNPGGMLYLSTMEGKYEDSGPEGPSTGEDVKLLMYYHEAGYLKAALEQNGFSLVGAWEIPQAEVQGASVHDLVLLGRKG